MKKIKDLTDITILRVFGCEYKVFWIPEAAKIYKLKFPDDVEGDAWGWCDFKELSIFIDESLLINKYRAAEVLIHEWVHAGHEFLALDDKSSEELFTELSAKMILSYMKDNPAEFLFIFNLINNTETTKPVSVKAKKAGKYKKRTK